MSATAEFFDVTPRNWRGRLAVSVDVMRELSRYTDPDEMYAVFVRRMGQLYPTARQIYLSRRGLENPWFRVTRYNLWKDAANPYKEPHRLPVLAGGLFADLVYADQPRVIDELMVSDDDPAAEFLAGQQSLLAIPLFEQGLATSVVVVTRDRPAAFAREQVPELVWMCNLFSRAMQTLVLSAKLQEAYDAADYELRTVATLQQSLLPAVVPQLPGLEIAVHYRTANLAGGDYYDCFPLPGGKLGVLIADVSGHGTPAAMLMAITHSLANSYPEAPVAPGKFLEHLNAHLAGRYTSATGHFVTAFYAVFDPHNGVVTYANAGHVPTRTAVGANRWRPVPLRYGLPLGVNPRDSAYPELTIPFAPGDRVALFTDGIVETTNRAGDPFGYDRLDTALGGPEASASVLLAGGLTDLDGFAAGTPIADDRTLLIVKRTAI